MFRVGFVNIGGSGLERVATRPRLESIAHRGSWRLGELLDRGGLPVKGAGFTVCSTGLESSYLAPMGVIYRQVTDMSVEPPVCSRWTLGAALGIPAALTRATSWMNGPTPGTTSSCSIPKR